MGGHFSAPQPRIPGTFLKPGNGRPKPEPTGLKRQSRGIIRSRMGAPEQHKDGLSLRVGQHVAGDHRSAHFHHSFEAPMIVLPRRSKVTSDNAGRSVRTAATSSPARRNTACGESCTRVVIADRVAGPTNWGRSCMCIRSPQKPPETIGHAIAPAATNAATPQDRVGKGGHVVGSTGERDSEFMDIVPTASASGISWLTSYLVSYSK